MVFLLSSVWELYFCCMQKSKDPLHGITLQKIVETLVDYYGIDTLAELINIKCFKENNK